MTTLRHIAAAASLIAMSAAPRTALAQRQAPAPADLILVNTKIYTVDDSHPFVEAMAVRDGRVAFVGSTREALLLRGPSTHVIDLAGRTVIPGMVDAHAHLFGLGTFLRDIDLTDTRSYETIVARVAGRVKDLPPGRWVIGRGWDQNKWGDTRFPTHDALSRVTPNNPVVLERIDGHAILANAAAMKAAGLTAATRDPAGGRIERTTTGEPTGVFVDNAMALVDRVVPALSHDEMKSAALAAITESNRWGLVGLHDPGEPREVLDVFEELAKEGKFNLRVYAMISDDSAAIEHYFQRGPQNGLYDDHLWIRAIKLYADGALGSRGAALLDPYADDPRNVGLLKSTPEHLRDVSIRALQHGFQVATHAIGDRGNRVALDAYQAALDKVLKAVDYQGLRREQAAKRADPNCPTLMGIGLSTFTEIVGAGPTKVCDILGIGLFDSCEIRVHPTGAVIARLGTMSQGQGHATTYAQIIATELGLPAADIVIEEGDTDKAPYGAGTWGSRSTPVAGAAAAQAARKVRDKARKIAAHLLEVGEGDLEWEVDRFKVKGNPSQAKTMKEICMVSHTGNLPPGMEQGLNAVAYYDPPNLTYPFGAYLCVVDIDKFTGEIKVRRFYALDDCGTRINPMVIEGQIHGGLTEAYAVAMGQQIPFDESGNHLGNSLMDYFLPTAVETPHWETDHTVTPCPHHPIGAKGVAESPHVGGIPCFSNAVIDAFAHLGVTHMDMPHSAYRVWQKCQALGLNKRQERG